MTEDPLTNIRQKQLDTLSDEEKNYLRTLLTKSNTGSLTPSEEVQLKKLRYAVAARMRDSFASTEMDPDLAHEKAAWMRSTTEPAALKSLGRGDAGYKAGVDPYADTAAVPSLAQAKETRSGLARRKDTENQDPKRPRGFASVKKENKIAKSYLRQIIKEELLVVLTDDEVKEMFGININEG